MTALETSPALQSMAEVLFSPSSPTFRNTGNKSKAAEMWELASLPRWELQARVGIVRAFAWLRHRRLSLAYMLGCAIPAEELCRLCGAQAAHGVLSRGASQTKHLRVQAAGVWVFFRSVLFRNGCCSGDV